MDASPTVGKCLLHIPYKEWNRDKLDPGLDEENWRKFEQWVNCTVMDKCGCEGGVCLGVTIPEWGAAEVDSTPGGEAPDIEYTGAVTTAEDIGGQTWRIPIPGGTFVGQCFLISVICSQHPLASATPSGITLSYEIPSLPDANLPTRYNDGVTIGLAPRVMFLVIAKHTNIDATHVKIHINGGDDLSVSETFTFLVTPDILPVSSTPDFSNAFISTNSHLIPGVTGPSVGVRYLMFAGIDYDGTGVTPTWTSDGLGSDEVNPGWVDDVQNVQISNMGFIPPGDITWTLSSGNFTLGAITLAIINTSQFIPLEVVNTDINATIKLWTNGEFTYLIQTNSPGIPITAPGMVDWTERVNNPYSIWQPNGGVYGWAVAADSTPLEFAGFHIFGDASGGGDPAPWTCTPPLPIDRTIPFGDLMRVGTGLSGSVTVSSPWVIQASANNGERQVVITTAPTVPSSISFSAPDTPDHWFVSEGQVNCSTDGGGPGGG